MLLLSVLLLLLPLLTSASVPSWTLQTDSAWTPLDNLRSPDGVALDGAGHLFVLTYLPGGAQVTWNIYAFNYPPPFNPPPHTLWTLTIGEIATIRGAGARQNNGDAVLLGGACSAACV